MYKVAYLYPSKESMKDEEKLRNWHRLEETKETETKRSVVMLGHSLEHRKDIRERNGEMQKKSLV